MRGTLEMALAWTFGLIVLFLLLSRAGEFNSIITSIGQFVTAQTTLLQGRGSAQVVPGTTRNPSLQTSLFGNSPYAV